MVDKTDLKMGLVLPFTVLVSTILAAAAYVLLSVGQGNLTLSLNEIITLIILMGGLLVVIPLFLTSVDVFQSKEISRKGKIAWLVTLWFAPGGILAAIYYIFKKKN